METQGTAATVCCRGRLSKALSSRPVSWCGPAHVACVPGVPGVTGVTGMPCACCCWLGVTDTNNYHAHVRMRPLPRRWLPNARLEGRAAHGHQHDCWLPQIRWAVDWRGGQHKSGQHKSGWAISFVTFNSTILHVHVLRAWARMGVWTHRTCRRVSEIELTATRGLLNITLTRDYFPPGRWQGYLQRRRARRQGQHHRRPGHRPVAQQPSTY